jgi:hypothetical protein
MRQATTVDTVWLLPVSSAMVAKARATYKQDDHVVLNITNDRIKIEDAAGKTKVSYTLTAEETLKLNHSKAVKIQLDFLTPGGQNMGTPAYCKSVGECLAGEVLV